MRKRSWLILLVLVIPSLACGNPYPWSDPHCDTVLFLDFGGGDNCVSPGPGELFTVRLCLEHMWWEVETGFLGVSLFWQTNTAPEVFVLGTDYSPSLGLVNAFGGPDNPLGWVIAPDACIDPHHEAICLAEVTYLCPFENTEGTIELLPNPVDGQLYVDCDFENQEWSVRAEPSGNGGIGGLNPPGGECVITPVGHSSWGAIKALYR
jgi:hypothetical protein